MSGTIISEILRFSAGLLFFHILNYAADKHFLLSKPSCRISTGLSATKADFPLGVSPDLWVFLYFIFKQQND